MSPADNTASSSATPSTSQAPSGGKVKQTRRRQRLSCVECTRRRQKCNRQIPCSLCISRGIPHLCRWEPILARPPPQRPPVGAYQADAPHQSTIATLTARIALLEKLLEQKGEKYESEEALHAIDHGPITLDEHPIDDPQDSSPPSRVPRGPSPSGSTNSAELSRYEHEVQAAVSQMAQLAIAPEKEYVGNGTMLYAIRKLGDPDSYRFPYARSATTMLSTTPGIDTHFSASIRRLVTYIPSREMTISLVDGFFVERGWQFGLPERWFRNALDHMWAHLSIRCAGQNCRISGGCPRCTREINPHWLCLLFAVLCLAPRRLQGANAKHHFWRAMEARRCVEDLMLSSSAYSTTPTQCVVHGVALGCLAAALLSTYLADRGRMSDAWKIIGTAVRNAQAVGLHRDPGWMKWERMDREEKELRLLAWWFVVNTDRMYSLILGRPTMITQGTFDVRLIPGSLHADGTDNPYGHYQQSFICLMHLCNETITKCLSLEVPSYSTVLDVDRKFTQWIVKVHPSMNWRVPHHYSDPPTCGEVQATLQRHACAAFYLAILMNLHRLYLMQAPPILPPSQSSSDTSTATVMNPSREKCIETAMELVQVLCDAAEECRRWATFAAVPSTVFHYPYFVFDGAVTLAGVFAQDPPHPKAQECLALIDRAVAMLERCRQDNKDSTDGEGDTATRAITILNALRKAGRWDERLGLQRPASCPPGPPPTSTSASASASTSSGTPSGQKLAYVCQMATRMSSCALVGAPPSSGGRQTYTNYAAQQTGFVPSLGSGSFPFINNAFCQTPSFPVPMPTMPGPYQVESSTRSASTILHGQQRGPWPEPVLGPGPAVRGREPGHGPEGRGSGAGTPANDFFLTGADGSTNVQTVVMPFDMLQNHESYEIDWAAIMDPAGGWTCGGGMHMPGDGQS